MAFVGSQVALSTVAAPLWAFESLPATESTLQSGTVQDPIPVVVICSSAMFLGGPTVTNTGADVGALWPANTPLAISVHGDLEVLYAILASSTATAMVLMGRQ